MDRKGFFNMFISPQSSPSDTANPPLSRGTLKTYKGKWDNPDVVHFLKRTMFGAKPSDVVYFKNMSFKQGKFLSN